MKLVYYQKHEWYKKMTSWNHVGTKYCPGWRHFVGEEHTLQLVTQSKAYVNEHTGLVDVPYLANKCTKWKSFYHLL